MLRTILAVSAATLMTPMVAPNSAQAQSFDCAKAITPIEKQICDDPNLSLMDTELGSVYGSLLQSLSGEAQSTLRNGQRAWLQQRNACNTATSECATDLYAKRLRQLDQDYDVFTGWSGSFTSATNLEISTNNPKDGPTYEISISGAGQNWTCDGTFSAKVNDQGTALVITQDNMTVNIQASGTGLQVPVELDGLIEAEGLCGAEAPSFGGFFARTSSQDDPTALDSRLSLAGIDSPNAVRAFLSTLKRLAANGDRQAFASLIKYPFNLYENGKVKATYSDQAAFLKDYDQIVTQAVLSAINEADYAGLFVNYQGVMIGNGQVWFDGYGNDDEPGSSILIRAINP